MRNDRKESGLRFGGESIPREVSALAHSRPLLRVKNIHPDLSGEDMSQLFESIGPVEFVKFDPKREDIAYICFQQNQSRNNSLAVSKFDGRKAMNQTLVVENATSLADRIVPAGGPRKSNTLLGKRKVNNLPGRNALRRKGRSEPKSVESLDAELSAYMEGSNGTNNPNQEEEQSDKVNSEMGNYQNAENRNELNQNMIDPDQGTNGQSHQNIDDTNDDMKLD